MNGKNRLADGEEWAEPECFSSAERALRSERSVQANGVHESWRMTAFAGNCYQ